MKKINNNIILFQNNRMENNSAILISNRKCIVIDPSWNGDRLIKYIEENDLELTAIIATHLHYDHVFDLDVFIERYKVINFYCSMKSKDEISFFLNNKNNNLFLNPKVNLNNVNIIYTDEKTKIDDFDISFILTPGHSESSMCIKYNDTIFTGDHIFVYDIGRTDLPFSNHIDMVKSINKLSKELNKENVNFNIIPGHGDSSNWEFVYKNNFYINKYKE